jgi:hypothetical protein
MRGGSSGRWGAGRGLSDWLRGGRSRLGCVRCDGFGAPDLPRASQFLTRRKHEDHGGPRRKKVWRFARSAFTGFRPDSYIVGLHCAELDSPPDGSDGIGTSDRWQASCLLIRSWPAAAPAPQWKKMVARRRRTNGRARQSKIFSTTDARRCTQIQSLICVHLRASAVDFPCSPTIHPNVGVYYHGRKHGDHGGPRRKKIWRFARSAFTRFRPDICLIEFYCPELMTPRQSSGYGAVFSGFLRGPPWSSRFLRFKNLLACLRARPDPGPWISSLGSGSSTRSATTPGMGACRGLAS